MSRLAKHRAPDPQDEFATEVTLTRVAKMLTGLGYETVAEFDRLVISGHDYVATVWISFSAPLALVIDGQRRVPAPFEQASTLAHFLDTWNHDRIAPTASYHMLDTGDLLIRLRSATFIKFGLTDDQLASALTGALNSMNTFSTEYRVHFLANDEDESLPETIKRAQDTEALRGPHPSTRHLPPDEELPVFGAPDPVEISGDEPLDEFEFSHVVEPLDQLDFRYSIADEDIVTTAVNGLGFALCVDSDTFFRVTGVYPTTLDPTHDFLSVWLACNEHNEEAVFTTAYTRVENDTLLLQVETACDISQGMALDQRSHFVVSSLVGILSGMDTVCLQACGYSIIDWPQ
ncbi:YbjN domain-containing protein [Corynebacterium breve]|uniref:YbjN domain-containing protein n=1 Tax=Corynebacterium breve TaxID=3049799 RepID=A0ABY8VDB9_9CORY|nr:YbjN domain-containing protein [Corynebacterium breve]WIM66936.1 YbjN domain-containing protein [Corynebacterium breve]